MLHLFMRYFFSMVAAAFLGFTAVHYAVYKTPPWRREASVDLNVTIRGSVGQAVPDAEIFLFTPQKRLVGKTDRNGELRSEVALPRGQVTILEAHGPTYRIRKDLPIPRMSRFRVDVRLDPHEAKLGHMTLISKTLEEMSRTLGEAGPRPSPSPQPTPTVAETTPEPSSPSAVIVDFSHEKIPSENNFEGAQVALGEAVETQNAFLAALHISRLRVRPLVSSGDPYFEILGYSNEGVMVSSVLFKISDLRSETFRRALLSLGRTRTGVSDRPGRLVIHTTRPNSARAYLNGITLPATVYADHVEFRFVPLRSGGTHVALSATADDRPLVRKVAAREVLERTVEWTLPEPSLSRR